MLYLVTTSLIWAFSFGLIKRYLGDVDSTYVTCIRLGLSMLVFAPFLRLRGVNGRTAAALAGIGAVQFGVMYLAYIESFRFLRAYEAALFTITTPIFVTLLADAFEARLHPRAWLAALLAIAGTALVTVRSADVHLTLTGLALVSTSNAAFALGQVWYRHLRRQRTELRDRDVFGLLYAGGLAVALIGLALRRPALMLHGPQIWTLLYLGIVASGLGFFLWNVGATRVPGGTLAVMNNAKIPLAVAVALTFFHEQANLPALVGSLAVLGFAVWLAERKPAAPRNKP